MPVQGLTYAPIFIPANSLEGMGDLDGHGTTIDANMLAQILQSDPSILQQLQQQGAIPMDSSHAISLEGDFLSFDQNAGAFDHHTRTLVMCDSCKSTFESQQAFDNHNCAAIVLRNITSGLEWAKNNMCIARILKLRVIL